MCFVLFFFLLLFLHLPIIYLSLAIAFFNFIFHCLTIYINLITVLLLLLLMSFLSLLLLLLLLSQLFLRKQVGESSKQGIQVAWSSPINHVKWSISRFRGVYRDLTVSGGSSFWYYLKAFDHSVMSQRAPLLVVVSVLYLPLHFIIIVIIIVVIAITFIANVIFIIFIIIRFFITSSLLFLWGKSTVWFCFFEFLHLSQPDPSDHHTVLTHYLHTIIGHHLIMVTWRKGT